MNFFYSNEFLYSLTYTYIYVNVNVNMLKVSLCKNHLNKQNLYDKNKQQHLTILIKKE